MPAKPLYDEAQQNETVRRGGSLGPFDALTTWFVLFAVVAVGTGVLLPFFGVGIRVWPPGLIPPGPERGGWLGLLPPLAFWVVAVLALSLIGSGLLALRLKKRRDTGAGLLEAFRSARDHINRWKDHLRPSMPQGLEVQVVAVEADPAKRRGGLPLLALLLLTLLLGALPMVACASGEGRVGETLTRLVCLTGFLALLLAQPTPPVGSFIVASGLGLLWILPPCIAAQRFPGWMEALILLPAALLARQIIRTIGGRDQSRFLLVGEDAAALGIPGRRLEVDVRSLRMQKPIVLFDGGETYRLRLHFTDGGVSDFHLASQIELERVSRADSSVTFGLDAKIRRDPASLRRSLAAFLGAATFVAALVGCGGMVLSRRHLDAFDGGVNEGAGKGSEQADRVLKLFPFSASGQLARARFAAASGRFRAAETALDEALRLSQGRGAAGRAAVMLKRERFDVFCRSAAALSLENSPKEGISTAVAQYVGLVRRLRPWGPSADDHYRWILPRIRSAVDVTGAGPPLARHLLAQCLDLSILRWGRSPRLSLETRRAWRAEAEVLFKDLEPHRNELPDWTESLARHHLRCERFEEAKALLKLEKGPASELLLASVCRFTNPDLSWPMKLVRKVGESHVAYRREAALLEGLMLAQEGEGKKAVQVLLAEGGDDDLGFQARYLNILARSQTKQSFPAPALLDAKLERASGGLAQGFDELLLPEWILPPDRAYLRALVRGKDGVDDPDGFAHLAHCSWYPFADRAKAYLKKWGR